MAQEHGVSLDGHIARQFDVDMAANHDLILVMENGHQRQIVQQAPELSGRVMLFDRWTGATGIPDPYRRSREFHKAVFDKVSSAADAWMGRLK